jgi:hypothetical protein
MLEVANDAIMCIKRETGYNYLDLVKPTLDESQGTYGGRYVCGESTKLCLADQTKADVGGVSPDQLFCFPKDA